MGWGAASSIAKILRLEDAFFPRSRPNSKVIKASWCIDKIQTDVLGKEIFFSAVNAEVRRARRSRRASILMLLKVNALVRDTAPQNIMAQVAKAVSLSTRETDLIGWYEDREKLGVLFTEVRDEERDRIAYLVGVKIVNALQQRLGFQLASEVFLSIQVLSPASDGDAIAAYVPAIQFPDQGNVAPLDLSRRSFDLVNVSELAP
jgi:hypothetical protein